MKLMDRFDPLNSALEAAMVLGTEETRMQPQGGTALEEVVAPGTEGPMMDYGVIGAAQSGDLSMKLLQLGLQGSGVKPGQSCAEEQGNSYLVTEATPRSTLDNVIPKRKYGRAPKLSHLHLPSTTTPISVPMPSCPHVTVENSPAALKTNTPQAMRAKEPKKRGRKSKAELLLMQIAQEAQAPQTPLLLREESETTPSGRPRRRTATTPFSHRHLMDYIVQGAVPSGNYNRKLSLLSLSGVMDTPSAQQDHGCVAEEKGDSSLVPEGILSSTLETPTPKRKYRRHPKRSPFTLPSADVPILMPPSVPSAVDNSPTAARNHTPQAKRSKVPRKPGRKSKTELQVMELASAPNTPLILRERDNESKEPEGTQRGRPRRSMATTPSRYRHLMDYCVKGAVQSGKCNKKLPLLSLSDLQGDVIETPSAPPDPGCATKDIDSSVPRKTSPVRRTPTPKQTRVQPTEHPHVNDCQSPVSTPVTPCQPASVQAKRRGRKCKAELLAIRLAREAEAAESARIVQELENEEPETTPRGQPRRRAAKTAIMFLHNLAEEMSVPGRSSSSTKPQEELEEDSPEEEPQRKKRRRRRSSSDAKDSDFEVSEAVLREMEKEEENDGMSEEVSEGELSLEGGPSTPSEFASRSSPQARGVSDNGIQNAIMAPVWRAAEITMEFRDSWHSNWEFPEWIPTVESWQFLSQREAETYLPLQTRSPTFITKREGIKEHDEPCTLRRFQSLPPHPQRWDMTFFVGGPVWAMDWCPTMGGSGSCQYLALYCHRGMDDRHQLDTTHTGPALLQLWSLGPLHMDRGGEAEAQFSYGLAVDHGCIWDLKFCPSGGWEPPCTPRKSSHMARLGLLAAAFSSGYIEIYSLPHTEGLYSYQKTQVKDPQSREVKVFKVDCVVRLQVGSIKAGEPGENGQCFTVAWHPTKPHQYLAAGFYDGTVSIWDLKTKSVLQKVRQGRVIKQYPFHSFSAHDQAVRNIEWCKADSNFLVTIGNDRHLKFWDFRRLYEPTNNIKRFLGTEMCWLLPYCGVAVAQDNCYASHGLCGIHYVDSGYLGYKPYFVAARKGTVWSISGSDWLCTITAGDMHGEVMAILLPNLNTSYINNKKPSNRRFPIYKADFVPCAVGTPNSTDEQPARHIEGNEWEHFKPKSYRAASGQFHLVFQDLDLTNFHNLPNRELSKRMQNNYTKGDLNLDRVQLEAVHKVRFNPNLDTHAWVASGGHSGLVRVHCIQALVSPTGWKLIDEKCNQFKAMFEEPDTVREAEYSPEVQHCVVQV
ncbi:general transcription factor 3C polypeptide 2 [Discoglossus pictus]